MTDDITVEDVLLAEVAEEMLAAGLRCAPADRATAEAGVRAAYAQAGRPPPEKILWFGSPSAGLRAVGALRAVDGGPDDGGPDAAVIEELHRQGARPGSTALGMSLRPALRTRPWALARSRTLARLGTIGYAQHWAASARKPWQQLMDEIAAPLRRRLDEQLSAEPWPASQAARPALLDAILGQHDAAWLGAFGASALTVSMPGDPAGVEVDPGIAALSAVALSAGWWWAYAHVAILTERPVEIQRDNLGRLHRGDGPALAYPDGFGLYAWRGMPIPPEVARSLAAVTLADIQAEANAEVRRVKLEHFGFDRYIQESGAQKEHEDETGVLWRIPLPGDEPVVMVEVVNATPEPDGTYRTYYLRVPPSVRTARAGAAWTFGLTEEEYSPQRQT